MRKLIYLVCSFTLMAHTTAQETTVTTTVIKLKDLITHAADTYPADDAVQLLLLFDTRVGSIDTDNRFYIEQGVHLLLKRLAADDRVAIGCYGARNEVVMPYTAVSNKAHIIAQLQALLYAPIQADTGDGINIAYNFANTNFVEDYENTVLMMRSDQVKTAVKPAAIASTLTTSVPTTKTKREERREARAATSAHPQLGGAIALTALSILPEVLAIIKD